MGLFFVYIIKSTICLTLFYLFYRVLLSKDTFHRFNRIALLSLVLLSVIIPLISISTEKATVIQYPMINLEALLQVMEQSSPESSQIVGLQILLILYMAGILFFIGQFTYSTWRIIRIVRSGLKIRLKKNIILIVTHHNIAPFSWMRYIVISQTDWEDNKDEIIAHELAHIGYHHSWDVIVSGLCVVFHWFNPAAWLLKQELQNIHEYEADEYVINQGIDAKKYQLLLIKKAVGTQRFTSMANSFNHSKLKKRITMMLKSKSNAWARLKYLYVLPLAAITMTAFARPEISRELDKISSTKISELPLIKEVLPEKKESVIPADTLANPDVDIQKHVNEALAKIHDMQALEEEKIQEVIDKAMAQVEKVNGQLSAIEEAKLNEQIERAIKESHEKIEKFAKQQERAMEISLTTSLAANNKIVIFIDGVKSSQAEFDNLDPEDIQSVNVQKNKRDTEAYGKDLEGVIFIETKKK